MLRALTFLLILTCSTSLFAQMHNEKDPKVGLVLSGGGAKGFAHIGALKVIDSLGVKIDYVAGTSMGGIIGGLYASGYSGKELDSIFKSVDFNEIVNDVLPREAKTFYERDQDERYVIALPFNKFDLKLPTALSKGQNVFNLLTKVLLHVSDQEDFSKLPIPFFCVATNIETGEAVILDKGNLPRSLTASGAFPSLFQPVIIDDKILIDGGVVNNYPVDELKSKGMDIIIGVDVQDSLLTRDQLKSAPDILLQINNYRTINDMKKKAGKTDILIKPDIRDFSVISFSEVQSIIKKGSLGAINQAEILKEVAVLQTSKRAEKKKIEPIDSITFKKIKIKGNKKYTYSYITGKLKIKRDEKTSYYNFNKGVNNLVATDNFDSFDYNIKKNFQGNYDLIATVKESETNTFLKFAVHYDDLYKTAFLANLTQKRILFNNDVASLDLVIGENLRYNFEYYIDKGFHWSVGLSSRYNQFDKNVNALSVLTQQQSDIFQVSKLDLEVEDFTNQFFIQTLLKKDLALSLGIEHKHLKITTETINQNNREAVFENNNYVSAFGKLNLDSFTNKYFPKRGFLVDCDFHLYFAKSTEEGVLPRFSIAKANFAFAYNINKKLTALVGSQGGFRIGENDTRSFDFGLGGYGNNFINGMTQMYGYDFLQLNGNSFVKGYAYLDYEILKKQHIKASANFANIGNDIFDTVDWISIPEYSGYALGYGLDSFLGPIEATWSYSPETKQSIWFFNVGFWF